MLMAPSTGQKSSFSLFVFLIFLFGGFRFWFVFVIVFLFSFCKDWMFKYNVGIISLLWYLERNHVLYMIFVTCNVSLASCHFKLWQSWERRGLCCRTVKGGLFFFLTDSLYIPFTACLLGTPSNNTHPLSLFRADRAP